MRFAAVLNGKFTGTTYDALTSEILAWAKKYNIIFVVSARETAEGDSPLLDEFRDGKREEMRLACKDEIESGIKHGALGSEHSYPTALTDQADLSGLVSKSILQNESGEPYKFWCADVYGVWERRGHTATQIQQVGIAVADHVIACKDKYEEKLAAIKVATIETLDTISWS
jgi:hypothetical protein